MKAFSSSARLELLALSSLLAASGWAMAQPVAVPKVEAIAPIGTGAVGKIDEIGVATIKALPSGLDKVSTPLVSVMGVGTDASAAKLPALLAKFRARETTPAKSWQAGDLELADVSALIDGLDAWGGFNWQQDVELRRTIVALLAQHGGERLDKPENFTIAQRLWLADYFWSVGDERAVGFAENVLSEFPDPVKGSVPAVYLAIERLGWHYRDAEQPEKSAQSWERMLTAMPDEGWWKSDAMLEAARAYTRAGQQQKAKALYLGVTQSGDAWFRGLAIYDQARALVAQGKHPEARALLQPMATSLELEPSRVAGLSLLGYSHYLTKEFDKARDFSAQTVALYQALAGKREGKGLEGSLRRASQILSLTQPKAVDPIVAQPRELHFVADSNAFFQGPERVITRRLVLRVLQPARLAINSDLPAMTVEIGEGWKPVVGSHWIEKEVKVKVNLDLLPQTGATQGTLKVSSAQSEFQKSVPVFIELR